MDDMQKLKEIFILVWRVFVVAFLFMIFFNTLPHAQSIKDTTVRIIDESPDSIVVEKEIRYWHFGFDEIDSSCAISVYRVYDSTTIDTVIYDRRGVSCIDTTIIPINSMIQHHSPMRELIIDSCGHWYYKVIQEYDDWSNKWYDTPDTTRGVNE